MLGNAQVRDAHLLLENGQRSGGGGKGIGKVGAVSGVPGRSPHIQIPKAITFLAAPVIQPQLLHHGGGVHPPVVVGDDLEGVVDLGAGDGGKQHIFAGTIDIASGKVAQGSDTVLIVDGHRGLHAVQLLGQLLLFGLNGKQDALEALPLWP